MLNGTRNRDQGSDGSSGTAATGHAHPGDGDERRRAVRTYLKFMVLALVLIGSAATIQITYFYGRVEPRFFVVPALVALIVGGLFGRVTLLRERLRHRNEQFRNIAELAQEFTYYRRIDGRYEYVSPACLTLTGCTTAEFYRTPNLMDRLIHPDERARWDRHVHAMNHNGRPEAIDVRIIARSGEVRWISHLCGPVHDADGRQTGVRATNLDITERRRFQEQIERMAYFDPLTDLPNRHSLQRRVAELVQEAADGDGPRFALLFLDLDRFKHLNDSFGHSFGDRLLRQMAERLRECCGGRATVTRFGGDEFVVLLPAVGDAGAVTAFAHELLAAVEQPLLEDGRELYISGTIGISLFPDDGGDADTLIRHADAAMYQSKRDRRGPVRLYSPELAHNASAFLGTESRLRRALKAGEFTVFYQSKVDLDSGAVVSLEALARWRDPQLGLLAPAEFIPVAEETGLILPLGDLILDQVCRQVSAWRVQGIAVPVAVNISVRQFTDADFCGRVERIAHAAGCPLSLLELEVTEQVLLEDVPGAIAKLGRLRAGGVSVALDDFGTGYSSLAYLRNLPIDVVKVDRSFVYEVSHSARDQAILRALIGLCGELQLTVVVEGIETREQCDLLRTLGCRLGQGFLYCQPMPAGQLEPLLRARGGRPQAVRD